MIESSPSFQLNVLGSGTCVPSLKRSSCSLLVEIGKKAFESMFNGPPFGPIPEYLSPHFSMHGCVAEYEARIEELDRWKAVKLSSWLQERVGRRYRAAGKAYQLYREGGRNSEPEKYYFKLIEHQA